MGGSPLGRALEPGILPRARVEGAKGARIGSSTAVRVLEGILKGTVISLSLGKGTPKSRSRSAPGVGRGPRGRLYLSRWGRVRLIAEGWVSGQRPDPGGVSRDPMPLLALRLV